VVESLDPQGEAYAAEAAALRRMSQADARFVDSRHEVVDVTMHPDGDDRVVVRTEWRFTLQLHDEPPQRLVVSQRVEMRRRESGWLFTEFFLEGEFRSE
jgi:hypothetical protein